ncbi:MAG: class I SAM-dependent methyltransferase [Candidatus Aenigmarchaeota archaeon]|nr:class I SAM-dependent methyltransferase [Candidatus Aenigmarchaeota archaeon]
MYSFKSGDIVVSTSLDEYFDIIDDSIAAYLLNECGTNTSVKEKRSLRSGVISLIEPHVKGSRTILDVGVGPGVNSLFFLKNGNIDKLIGMDNDPKVLNVFLQNAEMLGVDDKVEVVEGDLTYGLDTRHSPDLILCMDMLYGDPSSVFGKNGSLRLDNNIAVGALSDAKADKIIITRLCGDLSGTCMNPHNMKQDLEDAGYHIVDFGSKIYGPSAIDYAIATRHP